MRMKKQIAVILGILLLATCLLAGCSSQEAPAPSADGTEKAKTSESAAAVQSADGEKSGKPVLGVSLFYRRDEYYKDLDASFVKEAADAGLDIIIQDADSDASKQTQQLEDFVQQGVDAIALAPCDPAGLVPAIEAAVDAGIPVVVFDNQAETDKVSTSVNFDYEEDGGMVGDWTANYINEKLDGKAKVAVIDFPQSPIVCGGRVNGFVNKVKELPGVEIVSQQDGKASRSDSMNVMENILTSNPDVQIVFGVNFDTCAGAKAAIEAAGRDDIIVVGSAYGEEEFQALANDDAILKAFSTSSPQQQAKDTVAAVVKILNGESVEKDTLSHSQLLDAQTIKDYDWESIIAARES